MMRSQRAQCSVQRQHRPTDAVFTEFPLKRTPNNTSTATLIVFGNEVVLRELLTVMDQGYPRCGVQCDEERLQSPPALGGSNVAPGSCLPGSMRMIVVAEIEGLDLFWSARNTLVLRAFRSREL